MNTEANTVTHAFMTTSASARVPAVVGPISSVLYVLCVICMLILIPSQAFAYRCSRAVSSEGEGVSISWYQRVIFFYLQQNGTDTILGNGEFNALRQSFIPWADDLTGTDLTFIEGPALSPQSTVGYDFLNPNANQNLLLFRDHDWPYVGSDPLIIALTTTTYNRVSGAILDADIEFNSANFSFANNAASNKTDLKNTAVHEIGHLLGLDHTSIAEATMAATAATGDIGKRDLAADDMNAILLKYPSGDANGYCLMEQVTNNCGYCAPPLRLKTIPTVSVGDSNDGLSSGGCQNTTSSTSNSTHPSHNLPLVSLLLLGSLLFRKRAHQSHIVS